MLLRKHLNNGGTFPVSPNIEKHALILPFHSMTLAEKTIFVEKGSALPVLNLDHPQIGVKAALAGDDLIHL